KQYRYFLFLTATLVSVALPSVMVNAQTGLRQIQGFVLDTAGVKLKGVTIRLTSTEDTIMTTSSDEGHYRIRGVKGTNLRISFSMLRYQIVNKTIPSQDLSSYIVMPNVVLVPQSSLIE